MKKIVIIINGSGECGKDTLCSISKSKYKVCIYSSIDIIKKLASNYGWDGKKDDRGRKLLSKIKEAFAEYNDLPTNYLYQLYDSFLKDDNEIMYAHIREPKEIEKFKSLIKECPCYTLLVKRDINKNWSNDSDKNVNDYNYDYEYINDTDIDGIENKFIPFLTDIYNK